MTLIPLGRALELFPIVTFASQRENCVGTTLNFAANHACEVNTQEGKLGIRHRVNQVAAKMSPVRLQFVVLASKRHDLRRRFQSAQSHQSIAVQSAACDQEPSFITSRTAPDCYMLCTSVDGGDFALSLNRMTVGDKQFNQFVANSRIIDNSRLWNMQCADASRMRFDFANALCIKPMDVTPFSMPR